MLIYIYILNINHKASHGVPPYKGLQSNSCYHCPWFSNITAWEDHTVTVENQFQTDQKTSYLLSRFHAN